MKVPTQRLIFSLPGRDLTLKVIKDVEMLITDPADEDKVPCWAEIWPAARGVALWIWQSISFPGEELLELGSGLGLPGVVCALKGAKVTFSDFNPAALEIAMENARLNGARNVAGFLADWRKFSLRRRFPWILCSDVTYDPKLNVYLLKIIQNNLSPGGNILVAHPGRRASFDFMKTLSDLYRWERFDTEIPVSIDDPYFPHYNINIHHWKQIV